jgi:hypothetical protein
LRNLTADLICDVRRAPAEENMATRQAFKAIYGGVVRDFEFPVTATVGELRAYLSKAFNLGECWVLGLSATPMADSAPLSGFSLKASRVMPPN